MYSNTTYHTTIKVLEESEVVHVYAYCVVPTEYGTAAVAAVRTT